MRTGWLSGEDGFLVHDADGSGSIDATELFGGPGLSGYAELAEWDSNGDGIVSADDIAFTDLQIWRDANENGITDAGELIFETERGKTRYLGDDRVAAFGPKGVGGEALDAFGYGVTTDLAVAASNDNQVSAWSEATFNLEKVA